MVIQAESAPLCPATLDAFNTLPALVAETHLLTLCGSRRWASTLSYRRPFTTVAHLEHAATNLWFLLDEQDWLEAFACHPRIGERAGEHTAARAGAGFAMHAGAEQAAAQQTLSGTIEQALAEGNHLYEQRFGFLYIVFASGRTAPELLDLLQCRLLRDRGTELHEAARQQHAITALRMQKWLGGQAAYPASFSS